MQISQLKRQRMWLLIASVMSGIVLLIMIAIVIYLVLAIKTVDD